ncbi:MAG: type I-B CRISPR-associated protein Cas7/Cst2/DevR [Nitrososphaerota archaeon]
MTMHLFGMVLTHKGIFANNRGESEGNTTTLHKILLDGEIYTTVSAESIRYSLREILQERKATLNRTTLSHREVSYKDKEFKNWPTYIDDDVFGFMHAKKETVSRRGILEVTRAISLTPWRGEVDHHFASAGSNPSIAEKDPIPYSVEVHATRYQFGFAMTPQMLGKESLDGKNKLSNKEKMGRLAAILEAIISLRRVGGNHARYFSDFSPEIVIYRWTDDPAPRYLYCFSLGEDGDISIDSLVAKIKVGDIKGSEIIAGCGIQIEGLNALKEMGGEIFPSVKEATEKMVQVMKKDFMNW